MMHLTPMERQLLLAKVYHYCWYNEAAYSEIQGFLDFWENNSTTKAVFFNQNNNDDSKTNG